MTVLTKRRVPAQTADELFDRLRANGPPPPWNDIPPLAPYLLSVGIFLGGMLERGDGRAGLPLVRRGGEPVRGPLL